MSTHLPSSRISSYLLNLHGLVFRTVSELYPHYSETLEQPHWNVGLPGHYLWLDQTNKLSRWECSDITDEQAKRPDLALIFMKRLIGIYTPCTPGGDEAIRAQVRKDLEQVKVLIQHNNIIDCI